MTEEEEYKALQAEVDFLASVTSGGYNSSKVARMQAQSVMLLYRSSNRLAKSSERLARVNICLTIGVFIVALLQLVMVGVQIWLMLPSLETLPLR
jgi:hypothetical protein